MQPALAYAIRAAASNVAASGPSFGSQSFAYTGGQQSFIVPTGVTSLTVNLWGAGGGAATGGIGKYKLSRGGFVQGTLTVTPGSTVYIYVGGKGGDGSGAVGGAAGYNGGGLGGGAGSFAGGGGGGATDIRVGGTTLADRKLVAGGGGGMGATESLTAAGWGGGLTAVNGAFYASFTSAGGGPGTQAAGGYAGSGSGNGNGLAGGLGVGADAVNYTSGMGAGGGGYYGGGSGGNQGFTASGGGGGSSYLGAATGTINTLGAQAGHGKAMFTWGAGINPVIDSPVYVSYTLGSSTANRQGTIVFPATVLAGDLFILETMADANGAYSFTGIPAGFVSQSLLSTTNYATGVWTYVAAGTEGGTSQAIVNVNTLVTNQVVVMYQFRGVNPTTPLGGPVVATLDANNTTTSSFPEGMSTVDGSIVVWIVNASNPASTWTRESQVKQQNATLSTIYRWGLFNSAINLAGGSSNLTFLQSTGQRTEAITLVLNPRLAVTATPPSDSFNRLAATNILGLADSGHRWSQLSGTWGISANQAYESSGVSAQHHATVGTTSVNHTAQATLSVVGDAGVIVRGVDNLNLIMASASAGILYKQVAGTFTNIGTFTAFANGDVMKITASGNIITVYKNGTSVLSVYEAANNTGQLVGLRHFTGATVRFDDFSAFVSPPPVPAYRSYVYGTHTGTTFTITRPTGTAVGDLLVLGFQLALADTVAPTISGWTRISAANNDIGVAFRRHALYTRVADLTATDVPTVTLADGSANGGWTVAAFQGSLTSGSDVTFTANGGGGTVVSTSKTPSAYALVINFYMSYSTASPFASSSDGFATAFNESTSGLFCSNLTTKVVQAGVASGVSQISTGSGNEHNVYSVILT